MSLWGPPFNPQQRETFTEDGKGEAVVCLAFFLTWLWGLVVRTTHTTTALALTPFGQEKGTEVMSSLDLGRLCTFLSYDLANIM